MPTRRKALLAGLLASLVLGSITTQALFVDSATVPANTTTTGAVDLAADPSATFTLPAMQPGDIAVRRVRVSNPGAVDLRYALTSTSTETTLATALTLQVRVDPLDGTCDTFSGNRLYNGPIASTGGTALSGNVATGAQIGDRVLKTGTAENMCLRVTLPLAATNSIASLSTTVTFTFQAEQTANNGPLLAYPPLSTLNDMFEGPLDDGLYVPWQNYVGSYTTGGRLALNPTSSYNGINTWNTYVATGGSVAVELVSPPNPGNGTTQTFFGLKDRATGGGPEFAWHNNNLVTQVRATDGATPTATSRAYNSTNHRWLRIRETGTRTYFDTSPNGSTWTTLWDVATPYSTSAMYLNLGAGFYGSEPSPGLALYDNLTGG